MEENGRFYVVASAFIINDKNEILITQRALNREHHPGEWETQSGRLHQGESIIEGLTREMKEELNVIVEPILPLSTFHFYRGQDKIEHLGVTYVCKIKSGSIKVDGKEEIAYKWVDKDGFKKIIKDGSILRDLEIFEGILAKGLI